MLIASQELRMLSRSLCHCQLTQSRVCCDGEDTDWGGTMKGWFRLTKDDEYEDHEGFWVGRGRGS